MAIIPQNPFQITKAVDFTDEEIRAYWVDYPFEGGFIDILSPASPMPIYILGGKGSGKTHLMRYYSFNLQRMRATTTLFDRVRKDGYLGIYLRCGGLNSARFSGKGQPEDLWDSLFQYYMDLTLADLVLSIVDDICNGEATLRQASRRIASRFSELLTDSRDRQFQKISQISRTLADERRELDKQVNNAAFTRKVSAQISANPGKLVFGIPKLVTEELPEFAGIKFLYLLDEVENLTERQQRYINTLVREKEDPASFRIGARLYGLVTKATFSAEEEIKEGSEYEQVLLDTHFRSKQEAAYRKFAAGLCLRRLEQHSIHVAQPSDTDPVSALGSYFEAEGASSPFEISLSNGSGEPPYFTRLRKQLSEQLSRHVLQLGTGLRTEIDLVLERLRVPANPILEKLNTFLLYQKWANGEDLLEASKEICAECSKFMKSPELSTNYNQSYKHWHLDLEAQLCRDYRSRYSYNGINSILDISDGIPRNALIVLKHIYKWSAFYDEKPFRDGRISRKAQNEGIRTASDWFFQDARPAGGKGRAVRDGIGRLAEVFRELRYADKPSEVSLIAFSVDSSSLSDEAQANIDLAERWSLLVNIQSGQRDRNSMRVDAKYQLNKMLAPRWDLATARRGAIALSAGEANAIFDNKISKGLTKLLRIRLARMNVPFGMTGEKKQVPLPGIGND